MTVPGTHTEVDQVIRGLLAEAVRVDNAVINRLPADTELFGPTIGLSSLAGATLLASIQRRFGVDVAGEDLNLDALFSIGTLCDFVAAHI